MLIDLNADLGEGAGTDADLMPLITSANISCGFHAGDADTIAAALELAMRFGVRVGAHPGYPDREHFGRRELVKSRLEVQLMCGYQLATLSGYAEVYGLTLGYLKPHGALYHQAVEDEEYAGGVVAAAADRLLPVVGMYDSSLQAAADGRELPFVPEGFADRRYQRDGTLVPRTEPDAILHDVKEVAAQVEWLVRAQGVRTICVHGDTPGAVEFVRAVRAALLDAGHELRPFA